MAQKKEWKDLTKKEKLTGLFGLIFLVVIIWLAVSSLLKKEPPLKDLPPYKIEKSQCWESYRKCTYDIRIEQKLSQEELTSIAQKLKSDSPSVDNIFIGYYLPCMIIGHGYWATSHFYPNLKIEIQEYMLESNPACLESKQE